MTLNDKQTPNPVSKLNIAFFGTSDRSTLILEALKENFNLVLCITKEDSKFGRHQTLKETQVKKWANQNNLKVITLNNFSGKNLQLVSEHLLNSRIDLGIVADFSLIIPRAIIDTPKYKLINIHFSLLPQYRGASPVQYALLNGDQITGITYYLMDDLMDTGDILYQIEYKLMGNETSGELYKILFQLASKNLSGDIYKYIKNELIRHIQEHSKATYTYSKTHPKKTFIFKEDAKIDWTQNLIQIERLIRAYNPWPIAWTDLENLEKNLLQIKTKCDILLVSLQTTVHTNNIATNTDVEKNKVIKVKSNHNKNLKIKIFAAQIEKNKLVIKNIQVEGSKILTWNQFENGYLEIS